MFCSKCGSMNPDDSRFCRSCGAPVPPAAINPTQNASAGQPPYIPPQNNIYTPPGAGYPPQSGVNTPPNMGYPPQNTGYIPPSGGYAPPNAGYGPQGGYPPRPLKKKNPALIAAGILAGLAVVIVAVVLLLTIDPDKNNNSNLSGGSSSDVVLGNNSGNPTDNGAIGVADDGFRENYTQILGGGTDKVTVMIYVCGADLESDSGCGTLDINEMLAADLGDNVTVVLETGGCVSWNTPGIIDGEVQRWTVQDGALVELEQRGQTPMLDAGELADFINFSVGNFPANRYELIFWDHGGGSLYGYGYDELYPDTVLFLPDIAAALDESGVKFDFVGFDACLMGTVEMAYMLEPYADYLIGSEETEPAYGWDYTPWLSALGENPSIDTVALGKVVVDSFLLQNAPSSSDQDSPDTTLSVVALREIPKVYETLCSYMSNATDALANKEFKTISTAVARTRAFAEGENYDLIDIVDFARQAGLSGEDELTAAIESAVKYSDSTARTGVYGLSMYFPYEELTVYGYAKEKFAAFGFGGPIYDFYDTFVSIMAGGQNNSTSRSLKENLTGQTDTQTDYSAYSWYDNSAVSSYTYDNIDYMELEILQDDAGNWYLPLTDEDWSLITEIEMQILLDDGEGYIDLGSDQYYETDEAGNLLLNYGADNTWVAIGGQIVCYYAESTIDTDTGTVFIGYVPAVLNGTTDIDIMLEWDGENADGYIAGYRLLGSNSTIGGEGTLGKGYKQFSPGDTIDFVCDYYTYDGDFDSSYYFGDPLTIGDTLPAVTYEDVGDGNVLECYMIVDIYQNYSWTETVEFSTAY